mmetsp:Transcript_38475/g.70593  ORF Transcript_38475/g.70593 Transcript_38475/m.70593 type:complete len:100 (-) Transcript_38475:2019-2318(-)
MYREIFDMGLSLIPNLIMIFPSLVASFYMQCQCFLLPLKDKKLLILDLDFDIHVSIGTIPSQSILRLYWIIIITSIKCGSRRHTQTLISLALSPSPQYS